MLITLTTDFGTSDPFVGIMKGVIAGINPNARVIDLCHAVPPHNVLLGALMLRHSAPYFPRGTIHVAVIDPGVGGARRPLLIEADGSYFVGPDNGVLSLALAGKPLPCIVHLSNPSSHLQPVSATFHGRDIFAPVAAYLALGVATPAFGESVADIARLKIPKVGRTARGLSGKVLYIDHFGNLFTNICERDLTGRSVDRPVVSVGDVTIRGLASNYAAAVQGEFVALINSWGLLEIAAYKDSAERRAAAQIGDKVELIWDK